MNKTRDMTPRILVRVVSGALKGEITEVVMMDTARPIPFRVIVHRDVVVGEILELDR